MEIVLAICLVARRFHEALVSDVLDNLGRTDFKPGPVVRRLKKYGFVESYSGSGNGQGHHTIHFFVRDRLEERLKQVDPGLFKRIHRALVEHYKNRLVDYGGDQTTESDYYVNLLHFENSGWQADTTEWLYHLAQLEKIEQAEPHQRRSSSTRHTRS